MAVQQPSLQWKIFQRAAASAGHEFRSDRLWDLYLAWHTDNSNQRGLMAVYDQLLGIPTQLFSHHYEKFQELVQKNSPKDLLSTEEFLQLRQQFVASQPGEMEEADDAAAAAAPGADDPPPGLEPQEKAEPLQSEEEIKFIREKILEARSTIYKKNEAEVQKRWSFEEGIKRPYFHVKPLERTQLRNWREYLDFEIQNSSHERVVVLFERCLIACALYEDLWLKYARYMEPHGSDAVRDVYRRACTIHLIKKPNIHMMWAAYEERSQNYEEADRILKQLETSMPELMEAMLRRINMARRRGLSEEVETLYKDAIEKAKTQRIGSHLAVKYARYLYKVMGDLQKALQVLQDALAKDPTNQHLYMQMVDAHYQQQTVDVEAIAVIFDSALSSEVSADHKLAFSQRKLEFLEDFGQDPFKIQEAMDEYAKMLKSHFANKKRNHEETGEETGNKDKKAKLEVNGTTTTATTADATAAYTYSQSWPASYAQGAYAGYPQGWTGYPTSYYQTQ